MGVIYKITSPSGRLYVGKTHDLRKRVNAYKCDVRKNRKDLKLHNSLRKYGWDAHILEVKRLKMPYWMKGRFTGLLNSIPIVTKIQKG